VNGWGTQSGIHPMYTIGAKRDQHGNLMRTSTTPEGKMSADHDWSGFDAAFAGTHHAPVTVPGKTVDNSAGVKSVANAARSAYAIPGMAAAGAVMSAAAPAAKQVIPPANVQPPATRRTLDGRTEYLDPQTGRYVQSTGPDKSSAPPQVNNGVQPQQTKQVSVKPIPAPITGPGGNAATDAANLAQSQSMYKPGGLTESAYQRQNRIANPAPNPAALAAAGTGVNVATRPGDVAKSSYATSAPVVSKSPTPGPAAGAPAATKGIPGIPWTQSANGMPPANEMSTPAAPAQPVKPTSAPTAVASAPAISPAPQDEIKRQKARTAYSLSRGGAL